MRILKDALIILYVIIAIISTILLLSFNKYKVSVFGDYSIVIVDSNELEPNFSKGDLVIVKASDGYRAGENIFFYNIVEKKVEVTLANISRVEDVTDGMSAYELPGGSLVSHDEVIGSTANVKVFHKIGSFVRLIESKYGYLILIVIPSGIALLYEIYYLVVTRKEEIEEEREEQERMKRLAKKRAKERLLAKKQEEEDNLVEENDFEEVVDEAEEEEIAEVVEEVEAEPEEIVPNSRESLKASIEQNKKAYEERIKKLKNNYDRKVEKHPEIEDDADLKVTNQSDKVEKENDLKEKENDEAASVVRKTKTTSASKRRIPSHGTLASARANAANKSKAASTEKSEPANQVKAEEKKETEVREIKKAVPTRKVGAAVARRAAATRATSTEKKTETTSETTAKSTTTKRPAVRRSTRVQPKKNISSRKVDEKD